MLCALISVKGRKGTIGMTEGLTTLSMQDTNTISIWNNGDGVPVEMHKEENVYVPELIFGHLLTSSNYDDDEKKVSHSCTAVMLLLCCWSSCP